MAYNNLDDLLGHMKNKFNKAVPPLKKIMDSVTITPEMNKKEQIKVESYKSASQNNQSLIKEKESENTEDNINESTEENTNTEICNKDHCVKTGSTINNTKSKINSNAVPQKAKRTSKRRPTQTNKSIIESAIARKEKSFEDYLKPKSRSTKHVKNKDVSPGKSDESTISQHPILKKSLQSSTKLHNSNKKIKRIASDTEKGDIEVDYLPNIPQETEFNLRRSQRTLSSDNKAGNAAVDPTSDEDYLLKAQLNSRLCKCTENKGIFMESNSVTGPILKCLKLPSSSAKMSFETNKKGSDYCSVERRSESPPIILSEHLEVLINNANVGVNNCNEYDLVEAIENEDLGKVAGILGSGNIDFKTRLGDYNNGTFLHLAILKGSIQIAYLLLSASVDIDLLDKEQNSSLMLAAIEHKNDIVRYLVKAGADITLKGTDGMTALHIAAKCGNLQACQIILGSSFSISNFVNSQDDGGWTPLVWACEHGYVDVAKYLVSKGAHVNIRDVEHNVALHWAAFSGSSHIIEVLLNWKCDVNVVNVHGDTPLHISAREDRYNCVIMLLGRNANISLVNKNNETPLDCTPKDGKCYVPLALNAQLGFAVSTYSNKPKSLLINDISKGRELNPIQCYNSIDSEIEPRNYTYIKKNCITSDDIQINMKVSTIQSCSCDDRCISSECACGRLSLKGWYDKEGKLLPEFNFCDPPLIFECNEMCACNSILCINRLVQKQLTQRFQLFKTNSKGWGIRTLNFIAKGTYVCEYVGEILTDTEADHREDDSYLFDLDNRDTDSFCIDAKYYGNFGRFINHSCDPNLHPVKVFIEHHDLRFPRIAFFAKRDIISDEELSFDYGDKFWLVKYKSFTCDCGANVCKYSEGTIEDTLEKYQMIT